MSRVVNQNTLTFSDKQNSLSPRGNNDLTFDSHDAMLNLNTSFDWRAEHVASRESKYTYFLGQTKVTRPPGKQRLGFRLSHDKVVDRETAANVRASLPIKIIFCRHFRVGMYEKHFKN